MSENKKPRICEVLGVEVGEGWTIHDWPYDGWVFIQHEHGLILTDRVDDTDSDIWTVCGNIWDNPELIGG